MFTYIPPKVITIENETPFSDSGSSGELIVKINESETIDNNLGKVKNVHEREFLLIENKINEIIVRLNEIDKEITNKKGLLKWLRNLFKRCI